MATGNVSLADSVCCERYYTAIGAHVTPSWFGVFSFYKRKINFFPLFYMNIDIYTNWAAALQHVSPDKYLRYSYISYNIK